jgi:hypothetical protein
MLALWDDEQDGAFFVSEQLSRGKERVALKNSTKAHAKASGHPARRVEQEARSPQARPASRLPVGHPQRSRSSSRAEQRDPRVQGDRKQSRDGSQDVDALAQAHARFAARRCRLGRGSGSGSPGGQRGGRAIHVSARVQRCRAGGPAAGILGSADGSIGWQQGAAKPPCNGY